MRLLNVRSLEFHEHYPSIPPYAIASHRWKRGTEATIRDIRDRNEVEKEGCVKVRGFADYIKAHIPYVEWFWIDTCCVNQDSSQEVSEAINSMFKWYRQAEVCLAYLADVKETDKLDQFKASEWFRRGWTLQELLAPRTVVFLTKDWRVIGHKGAGRGKSGIDIISGPSLTALIVTATRIPDKVLNDFEQSQELTIQERLEWISGRETMRAEDMSYSLLGIFDLTMPVIYGEGGQRARERLVRKIQKKVEASAQKAVLGPPAQDTLTKTFFNVPFRRDLDFVDRGTLLDLAGQKLALPGGRAALVGLGGAGKSQLAIEIAYRIRERLPERSVFWIYASNAARFEQGLRDVADLVKIPGRNDPKADLCKLVRDWLRESVSSPWVVILDNVDDAEFLVERRAARDDYAAGIHARLSYFGSLPVCDHGSILVTSRSESAAIKLIERSDTIAINPMDKETAITLLEKKLGKQEDKKDALELVEKLEYMPLAITQAAAYIGQRRGRCSIRQYTEKVHKSNTSTKSILDWDTEDLRRDHDACNSIISTWQISFQHIRQIRPSAADLLSLMSFCDRQAIPEAILRRHAIRKDDESSKKLRGHDSNNHSEPNSDSADSDSGTVRDDGPDELDDELDKDIMMLEDYSFISQTTDVSAFDMHRLVQVATRRWLNLQGQLEYWHEQHINNLWALFPPGCYENWPICQIYYPHVRLLAEMKPRGRNAVLNWARLMYSAAEYASRRVNAADAGMMATLSLKARTHLLGEHNEDTLSSKAMLALAWASAGRWNEAQELQIQVVEARKNILGTGHPDTLTSMDELASTYGHKGQWEEVERLQVHVVQQREKTLPVDHPDLLKSMSGLVWTYYSQGRMDTAKDLGEYVEKNMSKALPETHPDVMVNTAYLGAIYEQLGEVNEAVAYKERVLTVRKQDLGDDHNLTLTSMTNLALTYRRQGMLQEAEELEVDALEKRRRLLGPSHPSTLLSMNNLAWTWLNQGHRVKAKDLMNECITASITQLGRTHGRTLNRIHLAPVFGIERCVACFRELSPAAQTGDTACDAFCCSSAV